MPDMRLLSKIFGAGFPSLNKLFTRFTALPSLQSTNVFSSH